MARATTRALCSPMNSASRSHAYFSEEKKFSAYVTRVELDHHDVWLMKPTTYMNRSGTAVQALAQYYHIEPEEILVVP